MKSEKVSNKTKSVKGEYDESEDQVFNKSKKYKRTLVKKQKQKLEKVIEMMTDIVRSMEKVHWNQGNEKEPEEYRKNADWKTKKTERTMICIKGWNI